MVTALANDTPDGTQYEEHLLTYENDIVGALLRAGIKEDEARVLAKKAISEMGMTKTVRGTCPRGKTSPTDCMLCGFGHMTECHYPYKCETVRCSHYRRDMLEQTMNDNETPQTRS